MNFFFCEIDPVKAPETYRNTQRLKKNTHKSCKSSRPPLTKKTYHGAPPPLLHSSLGSEGVPRRTGSRENSARESLHLASSSSPSIWTPSPSPSKSSTRIRRTASSGTGKRRSTALRSREHPRGSRSVAVLHGAPPPERISASTKHRTGRAILSPTPPAGKPHNPRLCTGEIQGFPTLPPPERPAEGGETGRSTPASWIERWGKKSPLLDCAGKRAGSKVPF